MKCHDVNQRLLFYLDNELREAEKREVELHLSVCSVCQKRLEALTKTHNILQQSFQPVNRKLAPAWLWIELKQRLAPQKVDRPDGLSGVAFRAKSLLVSRPRWRLVLVGVLILVLVLASSMFAPKLFEPSQEVIAANITQDTPEVKALVGGEPSIQATRVAGTVAYVLSRGPLDDSNLAYVDLQNQIVTRLFRLPVPDLTPEDRAKVLEIAEADATLGPILGNGGSIDIISPVFTRFGLDLVDGLPAVWTEGIMASVIIKTNDQKWVAKVDLTQNKVTDISLLHSPSSFVSQLVTPETREKLIRIAQADARVNSLLDSGAEIVNVAAGSGKMAGKASVILKNGEEIWAVGIDIETQTVNRVEPVPAAKYSKANFFKAGR